MVLGPREHVRQEPRRSSGGQRRTAATGPRGLILASAPGATPGPLRFAPSLRKQAALDGILQRYTSNSTVYMSLSIGVYFLVLLQIGMPEFSPGSTEYSLQTITAPPHPSPPGRLYSRLPPSHAAALTRRYRPPLRSPQQR